MRSVDIYFYVFLLLCMPLYAFASLLSATTFNGSPRMKGKMWKINQKKKRLCNEKIPNWNWIEENLHDCRFVLPGVSLSSLTLSQCIHCFLTFIAFIAQISLKWLSVLFSLLLLFLFGCQFRQKKINFMKENRNTVDLERIYDGFDSWADEPIKAEINGIQIWGFSIWKCCKYSCSIYTIIT